ncbi:MAG: glycosyltransferase family 39 protein [Thermodesulfobacteriota bacterium]|nr:glycosyltransferase family 39 protein [Thermodesulfobacteriota bacterium]
MQFREIIDNDGVHYVMLGKNLFSGNGYTEPEGIYQWYYPPFFPINVGLLWVLIRDIEMAGEWISLIYGSLLPIGVFYVAYLIYNFKTGLIAGFLTALFPPFIEFSSSATAEIIFTSYTIIFACLGYILIKKQRILLLLPLGLLAGIIYLTKPAGIQYLGVSILLMSMWAWYGSRGKIAIIKGMITFLIGWAILCSPYLIYLHNHYGRWTFSELSTRNLYRTVLVSNNESKEKEYILTEDKKEMVYFTSPSYAGKDLGIWDVFQDDPHMFLYGYFQNLVIQTKRVFTYGHTKVTGLLFLLVVVFSFLRNHWSRQGIINMAFLGSMLLPFFTYPLVSSEAKRWLLPFIAILMVLYAKGIVEIQEGVRSWRIFPKSRHVQFLRGYGVYVIIILCISFETLSILPTSIKSQQHYYPIEHKEMGLLMKENKISKDVVIMSITPQTSFYAQAKFKVIPWGEYSDIIDYARYHGVNYFVVDETYIPRRRPQLAFLLDENNTPSELKLKHKLIGKNKKKILAYEFTKGASL